jgi:hypothetical protein
MLSHLILASGLVAAGLAGGIDDMAADTPEQLAVGAVREIVSAQAVHKEMSPDIGYACGLEPLVEAQILLDTWLAGTRVEGYRFQLWCDTTDRPQTTFRASAVPRKKGSGATLTVCTNESNVVRTIEGDVASCFEKGRGPDE